MEYSQCSERPCGTRSKAVAIFGRCNLPQSAYRNSQPHMLYALSPSSKNTLKSHFRISLVLKYQDCLLNTNAVIDEVFQIHFFKYPSLSTVSSLKTWELEISPLPHFQHIMVRQTSITITYAFSKKVQIGGLQQSLIHRNSDAIWITYC